MKKKILVTGGAGFIGAHLCRALVKAGHEVRVLDLVAPLQAVPSVSYVKGDVRDEDCVARMVDGVDAVYHFAAMVSVPLCQERPVESYQTNLVSTAGVLEAIRRVNLHREMGNKVRFLFSGSAVVYGNAGREAIPLKEDDLTPWPLSYYGAQKLGSEQTIRLYRDHHGVPAVVFRFFNVYGPGQDPKSPYSGVISIFSDAIKEGRSLRLFDQGRNTRDFVSVHDLVRAFLLALELPEESCDGRAMNLGSGRVLSVQEIAQRMVELSGKKVKLENLPPREGDILHSLADVSRAEKVLNWKPAISFEEGLREILHADLLRLGRHA